MRSPDFLQVALALFFVWVGLKIIEHLAPRWAGWYIALIAISIVIYYKNQLSAFLDTMRGQLNKKSP